MMKAIPMKKMINCVAMSGVLLFTAGQTMAMNQQSSTAAQANSKASNDSRMNLTESQVIKVVSTVNNGEIKQAKQPCLKTDDARKYAQMMISEHTANEKKARLWQAV